MSDTAVRVIFGVIGLIGILAIPLAANILMGAALERLLHDLFPPSKDKK